MPIMDFGRIGQGASLEELIDMLAKLQKTLDFLMQGGLDSKNIRAKSVQADRMDVDELSAITANLGEVIAGIITGVLIRTASSGKRIELTGNKIRTYNESEHLQGPAWGDIFGPNYGDLPFFDDGVETLLIKCLGGSNGYQIGPNSGADMYLGETGLDTVGLGNWSLPASTSIGSVTSDEISYLSGAAGNLQNQIINKANAFSGYDGTVTVVTDVDFGSSSVTTTNLNFSNGILTSVS